MGGKVQVTVERVQSHIELSVSDTGDGIDPDYLPHVFERFSQGERPLAKHQKGLGLGLAIVKSLAELHGGTVRAKSGGAGKGSTFIISLPVSVVRSLTAGEPRPHPSASMEGEDLPCPDLSGVHVVVVDDDQERAEVGQAHPRELQRESDGLWERGGLPEASRHATADGPHHRHRDAGNGRLLVHQGGAGLAARGRGNDAGGRADRTRTVARPPSGDADRIRHPRRAAGGAERVGSRRGQAGAAGIAGGAGHGNSTRCRQCIGDRAYVPSFPIKPAGPWSSDCSGVGQDSADRNPFARISS